MARNTTIIILVLAFVVGLAGPGARADENGEAKAEERVVITFEGPLELELFLKKTAEALNLPLVWNPKSRALQGKEVIGEVKLQGTRTEILDGLRSLLTYYELVLIPTGAGANRKILVMDARQTAAIVKLKPTYIELNDDNLGEFEDKDGLFVTTTIRVNHMDNLRDARNALNRIVTGQNIGNVTEVPAARAFVVTDFAPNVVAIYLLLREMDVPFAGATPEAAEREVIFQAVRLKHAVAREVASTLTQMFGGPTHKKQAPVRTPQQAMSQVPPTPGLRIQPDARLNQVLITGMRQDVERVLEVLKAMDQPKTVATVELQFIRLQHVEAIGAAAALNQLIRRYPEAWQAQPGMGSLPVVEAHPETNGLLVQAPGDAATRLRRLVTEMDQPVEEPEGAADK